MSAVSDILGSIESGVAGATSGINWSVLAQVVASAEAALPAIEQGIISGAPFVKAIITVLSGGTPTADDWAAMDAALDAGSAALAAAAAQPDPNV